MPSADAQTSAKELRARAHRAELELRTLHVEAKLAAAKSMLLGADGARAPRGPVAYTSSYTATRRSRLSGAFGGSSLPPGGSGDHHYDPLTQDTTRRESQHVARNSGIANGIIGRLADCVIGGRGGPRLQCLSTDKEWNQRAEEWFTEWAEDMEVRGLTSFVGVCRQVIESVARDGNLLSVKTRAGRIQLIEDERFGGRSYARNTTEKVGGITLDTFGRPVSYEVGEYNALGGIHKPTIVPASAAFMLRNPIATRISQTRGEPVLMRAIDPLRRLEDFMGSTDVAARVGAYNALVIHTENPAAMQAAMPGVADVPAEGGTSGQTQKEQTWGPGSVLHLGERERATQIKPEYPNVQIEPYICLRLRMIGTEIGLPLELLLLDFSKAVFYSGRAASIFAWLRFSFWQEELRRWLKDLWRWRLAMAIDAGELQMPSDGKWKAHKWTMTPMPQIDLKQEHEGRLVGVAGGLISRRQAIEEVGGDYEEVERQRVEEYLRDIEQGTAPATPSGMMPAGSVAVDNRLKQASTGDATAQDQAGSAAGA